MNEKATGMTGRSFYCGWSKVFRLLMNYHASPLRPGVGFVLFTLELVTNGKIERDWNELLGCSRPSLRDKKQIARRTRTASCTRIYDEPAKQLPPQRHQDAEKDILVVDTLFTDLPECRGRRDISLSVEWSTFHNGRLRRPEQRRRGLRQFPYRGVRGFLRHRRQ